MRDQYLAQLFCKRNFNDSTLTQFRTSQRRCPAKKVFLKFRKSHKKTPALESFLIKLQALRRDSNNGVFP